MEKDIIEQEEKFIKKLEQLEANRLSNDKLLTKADLAKRWQVSEQTIDEYREKGIIKKVPKIPSIRFNPQHIRDIEETKLDRFSPLERKKLEREIEVLKQKLSEYEDIRIIILNASTRMINL